tara:strand:+ start:604 stop:1452 length:849 start_codon:yes stop_codon:yes gene_type:complete
MNIVGIGTPGCRITKEFTKYPQYKTFFIDTSNSDGYKNFMKIVERKTHQEYEEKYKKLNFKNLKGETTLVLAGSGKITGILLRLLEQLKDRSVSVLYIKPDVSSFTEEQVKIEKLVFGILQEYARSNLLKSLHIVSNLQVEKILDNVSISSYWQDINSVICSTYHMLNVFENTEPLLNNTADPGPTCKICTLGVVGYKTLNEKLFYNLQKTRLKKYFFGISEKTLNEEKDLLQKIRDYVKEKSDMEEKCVSSFSIYSTQYEQDYVYTIHYASFIQEQNIVYK